MPGSVAADLGEQTAEGWDEMMADLEWQQQPQVKTPQVMLSMPQVASCLPQPCRLRRSMRQLHALK